MSSPLKELISIGSYPLVPPSIYRATASLSFYAPANSWMSKVPRSLRLRNIREFLSTLEIAYEFHHEANMDETWEADVKLAQLREQYYFFNSEDVDEYRKRAKQSCETANRANGPLLKWRYKGIIRVRSLTELAFMAVWSGVSEEVRETASAPTNDPVRLLLQVLHNQETTGEPTTKRRKL